MEETMNNSDGVEILWRVRFELDRLRLAWQAVQHEEPLGDPRHFALIDD